MITSKEEHAKRLFLKLAEADRHLLLAGSRVEAITPRGNPEWGLLSILAEQGPRTLPQLARARGVKPQSIQKIVGKLLHDRLIVRIDNPDHKRAKLLRLTDTGKQYFCQLDARVHRGAELLTEGITLDGLQTAIDVLDQLIENAHKQAADASA